MYLPSICFHDRVCLSGRLDGLVRHKLSSRDVWLFCLSPSAVLSLMANWEPASVLAYQTAYNGRGVSAT